jgi:large subunit ribosomal protein L13
MQSSTRIRPSMVQRKWHVVDVKDQTLGRIASQIAKLLIGKHKPYFVNHQDTGDYVIVINAALVKTTGNKMKQKNYYRHSGYPGGLKTRTLSQMLEKDPRKVIEHAVRGMIPHTKLGESMYAKLYVYSDDTHPHADKLAGNKEKKGE